jgi:hypothetical protein
MIKFFGYDAYWFKECCEVERKALGAFVNDGSYYP